MRGLSKATVELILFAKNLLEECYPQTLRQLHYAIFSAALIAYNNDLSSYRRLSRVTEARRLYRDWELNGTDEHPQDLARSGQLEAVPVK